MAGLIQYKCPNCAGAISFDPTAQNMKCPYCDTTFDVSVLKDLEEKTKDSQQSDDMEWERESDATWTDTDSKDMSVYVCQSCGGEIIADSTLAATKCPFCDNPIVMKGRLTGDLKPDLIIPFKKTKENAKEAYLEHLKGKPLLPKVFREQNHIDEIKGLYVPVWLFDSDVDADYSFNAVKKRYWSDSNFDYTETSYYKLVRSGSIGFEKIPVDGSEKMPDALMESIEPFDYNEGVDFQTAYLAGYLADKYDVDAQHCENRANERIKNSTESEFLSTTNSFEEVTVADSSVRLKNGSYKYALYPVWLLNTTWQENKYTFIMNGQTGKMAGDLPTDKGALVRWLLGLTVICTAIAYVIMMLLGLF